MYLYIVEDCVWGSFSCGAVVVTAVRLFVCLFITSCRFCFICTVFGDVFACVVVFVVVVVVVVEVVPMVEFIHLVFSRLPGESYSRGLRSLLCLVDVFRTLITSLVR